VLVSLFADMLGDDYKIVELGFDVPLPGAVHQPWHRDFPAPPESAERRLTSLAVNATTVDVTPDMGPFEIVPGSHWDDGGDFEHGMFPPPGVAAERYDGRGSRRHPRQGDVSVRSGLAVHRGTPNVSQQARGVLILGVTARHVDTGVHQLAVRPDHLAALPATVRDHLACTVTDELTPIEQRHDIEGLMMG
jgi:ectoine hydroxylase-related dioxygenase (phytanoyl-CoA dioxygenase family)